VSQPTSPPYPGSVIGQNTIARGRDEGDFKVLYGHTSWKLVPQEKYTPPRQQKGIEGPQTIEFSVRGAKGICLSDALEGRWVDLEGRDDRSLLGEHRTQIMLRLQVRFPASETEYGD
jgi:hypothetical protein